MAEKKYKDGLLLGAHTSAAGGVWKALEEAEKIGATMLQCFTANQRQWHSAPLSEETADKFKQHRAQGNVSKVMSHASYLINLGSPDPQARSKSQKAFIAEIERCIKLGIDYLNFHPGAALQGSREACLDHIIANLLAVQPLLADGTQLRLLVETTAGQGSLVGYTFEEIGYLVAACADKIPFGVCIDTCHIFAAGYDIRTAQGWDKTLKAFDQAVGLQHLYAFHLNDSMHELGSRKDRHAPLGEGHIGLEAFAYLIQSPHTAHLPMCLETPGGPQRWQEELKLLRSFIL